MGGYLSLGLFCKRVQDTFSPGLRYPQGVNHVPAKPADLRQVVDMAFRQYLHQIGGKTNYAGFKYLHRCRYLSPRILALCKPIHGIGQSNDLFQVV